MCYSHCAFRDLQHPRNLIYREGIMCRILILAVEMDCMDCLPNTDY